MQLRTFLSWLLLIAPSYLFSQTYPLTSVEATVETAPVFSSGDAADDPAIWIHPTNPELSLIIGTDKVGGTGGLLVFDMSGALVQYLGLPVEANNVDVRYNFPLAGGFVDIVGFSNEEDDAIYIYKVDPATRTLSNIAVNGGLDPDQKVYGFCLYHSPVSGKYYAIVTKKSGEIKQFELFDAGGGLVDMTLARSIVLGSQTEGVVADDIFATLYAAEEDSAIWKYGAEPSTGSARTLVAAVDNDKLDDDLEGLTIYYASDSTGYLIASSQGSSEFAVFRREGNNDYLFNFEIVQSGSSSIDEVSTTDGIDVVNVPLGPSFPFGAFVAQDNDNTGGNQNFKLVPWEAIAGSISPPLTISTSWDPRLVGAPFPPAPPTSLIAVTAGPTQIDLAWSDNASNEGGFRVERKTGTGVFAEIAILAANTSSYNDTGLNPNQSYTYRVSAFNPAGSSAFSNEAVATTDPPAPPPAPPTNLNARATGAFSIDLSWQDNATTENGFKIERSAAGGSFAEIAVVNADLTAFSDTGLAANTAYSYRVRAFHQTGTSAYSNTASATTTAPPPPPPAPGNLVATATGAFSISLAWTENSSTESGFKVERQSGGGAFAEIAQLPANSTSFDDAGLGPNTQYTYRVLAFNGSGSSPFSNEASATTSSGANINLALNKPVLASSEETDNPAANSVDGDANTFWESDNVNDAAPQEWLRVDLGSQQVVGQVVVRWKSKSYAENYEIQVSADDVTWTTVATQSKSDEGDDEVTFASTPARYVRVFMTLNKKSHYEIIELEVYAGAAPPTPPSPPGGLGAVANGAASIDLSWADNSVSESGFVVERHDGTGPFAAVDTLSADAASFRDTDVLPATTYTYRVSAFNAAGNSGYSNEASATTGPPPPVPQAPANLGASPAGPSAIDLVWDDLATTESGFRVERQSSGSFSEIAVTGPDATAFTDTGLSALTTYTYRVRAFNTTGNSAYSNSASATTDDATNANLALGRPATASTTDADQPVPNAVDGDLNSFWESDQSGAGADWYRVDLESAQSIGLVIIRWKSKNYATSFEVQTSPDDQTWTTVAAMSKSEKGDDELTFSEVSARFVRLYLLESKKSDYEIYEVEVYAPGAVPTRPAGPGALALSDVGEGDVMLTWTDNSAFETGFQIERRTPLSQFTRIAAVDAGVTSYLHRDARPEEMPEYRLRAVRGKAGSGFTDPVVFPTADGVSVDVRDSGVQAVPSDFVLFQNHPNPFNPSTRITFALPQAAPVQISVYDRAGVQVANLVNGRRAAGRHSVDFAPGSLPSGVYFYELRAGNAVHVRKLLYLK